jgi:hypothetical protein
MPKISHPVFRQNCLDGQTFLLCLSYSGTFKCTAVQMHNMMVTMQLERILNVPRTCGSGCHCAVRFSSGEPNGANMLYCRDSQCVLVRKLEADRNFRAGDRQSIRLQIGAAGVAQHASVFLAPTIRACVKENSYCDWSKDFVFQVIPRKWNIGSH